MSPSEYQTAIRSLHDEEIEVWNRVKVFLVGDKEKYVLNHGSDLEEQNTRNIALEISSGKGYIIEKLESFNQIVNEL